MPLACVDRDNMGFDFGLQSADACFPKMKFRWLFQIEGVSATVNALPPLKASRPQLTFKEQQVAHLTQDIYYPVLPEWKPINLTLYDITPNRNLVFDWIRTLYDPNGEVEWRPVYSPECQDGMCFKRNAILCCYDGCGKVTEKWKFENCYPNSVDWGDLDMGNSEVMTVDMTLRYDRAYIEYEDRISNIN